MTVILTVRGSSVSAGGDLPSSGADAAARFEFDSGWDGFIKTAVFFRSTREPYRVLLTGDRCEIPHAMLASAGTLYIGVFGTRGAEICGSAFCAVPVAAGAADGNIPDAPQASVYAQLADMVENCTERVDALDTEIHAALDAFEASVTAAETGRVAEENQRCQRELLRGEAENARAASEAERVLAEAERAAAEVLRASEEAVRTEGEATRGAGENARAVQETLRAAAEQARESAESTRAAAESDRNEAELEREAQELEREASLAVLSGSTANAFTKTVSGASIRVDDVSPLTHRPKWVQYGQSGQDGTPSPDAPVPVTYKTAGAAVRGKNLFDKSSSLARAVGCTISETDNGVRLTASQSGAGLCGYVLLGSAAEYSGKTLRVSARVSSDITQPGSVEAVYSETDSFAVFSSLATQSHASGIGFTVNLGAYASGYIGIAFTASKAASSVSGNWTQYDNVQVELGSVTTDYQEHKDVQTVTVKDAENNDIVLCGIPVGTGGDGNVTIGGRRYISDTVDESGTVTRRVGAVDLGLLGWGYDGGFFYATVNDLRVDGTSEDAGSICNLLCAEYVSRSWYDVIHHVVEGIANRSYISRIGIFDSRYNTVAEFSAALSGVMLYYELIDPVIEQATVVNANADSPTMTWISDAHSEVTYNRDAVKVVEELTNAIIALGGNI